MLTRKDRVKIEFVLEMIIVAQKIIERHGSVSNAIEDIEGWNALLMCLLQIGETLQRIESDEIRKRLPVKETSAVRNFIAHGYENVNKKIIENIYKINIVELKVQIENILDEFGMAE